MIQAKRQIRSVRSRKWAPYFWSAFAPWNPLRQRGVPATQDAACGLWHWRLFGTWQDAMEALLHNG